jgi:hypothetical protein
VRSSTRRCRPQSEGAGRPLRRAVITKWDPVNGVGGALVLDVDVDVEAWFHSSAVDAADLTGVRVGVVVFGDFEDVRQDGYSLRATCIRLHDDETRGTPLRATAGGAGYSSDLQLSFDEDAQQLQLSQVTVSRC